MKKISYNDLKTTFPKIDTIVNNELYLNLYSFYHDLITKYLIKKFELDSFDNHFSESNLNYKKVPDDQMDIYQYLSSSNLKYFYLRNNIHMERLTQEELNFFMNKLDNNDELIDEATEKMIESTINKVLSEKEGDSILTNYGPESSQFYAPRNSLIIGFRYDEYNGEGMTDDEWDSNHEKQIQDKFHQKILLENLVVNYEIMPVSIIEYDIYSVKQRQNDINMKVGM